MKRAGLAVWTVMGVCGVAAAAPTGLNVIPTTDIVPLNSYIFAIQNGNTSFTDPTFYRVPTLTEQLQFAVIDWLEAGFDYAQTPDVNTNATVFNAKALLHTEDELTPNVAFGVWNVTQRQIPGYYLTLSKTLNYDQQQYERFRAHHRRNRKLLGRRAHIGMMLSNGILQPFLGTDLQLNETAVFQADFVSGAGNAVTAGLSYVLPDQRTVLNPALLFSNDTKRFSGLQININHQFNM